MTWPTTTAHVGTFSGVVVGLFVCLFVGWLVGCLFVCVFVCLFVCLLLVVVVVGGSFWGFSGLGRKLGGDCRKKAPPHKKKRMLGGETNANFFFLPSRLRALFSAFFAFSPVCVLKRP